MMYSFRSSIPAICFAVAALCFPVPASLRAQAGLGNMFGSLRGNGDAKTPTVITANAMDVDLENNLTTLIGSVVIDDAKTRITCDKMVIYFEEKGMDTLTGKTDSKAPASAVSGEEKAKETGKPAETVKPAETAKPAAKDDEDDEKLPEMKSVKDDEESTSKKISKIVCTGDVVYVKRADKSSNPNAKDEIATADKATYDVEKDIIVMTGNPVLLKGKDKMNCDRIDIFMKEGNRMLAYNPVVRYVGDSDLGSISGSSDKKASGGADK